MSNTIPQEVHDKFWHMAMERCPVSETKYSLYKEGLETGYQSRNEEVEELKKGLRVNQEYAEHLEKQTAALTARVRELEEFARDIRDNWDCDEDAHRYDTVCRACEAKKILPKPPNP